MWRIVCDVPETPAVRIGLRIKHCRGHRTITEMVRLLAAPVDRTTWSRWETGSYPGPDRQLDIADALDVDWAWLFDPRYDEAKNGHDDG